ncbi:MAG: hypothetical protein NTY38_03650, partial [Acidobacteria bacterium]|nr:hypothetical protein [Acidobacteriota bacterium]
MHNLGNLAGKSRRDILQMLGMAGVAGAQRGFAKAKAKPPRRAISTKRPLFLLEGGIPMWNLLPADFRAYCAVMFGAGSGAGLRSELARFRDAGIPVVISVQNDEADNRPTPLETVASAFDEFPNLIGCRACELSCGPGLTAPERRNLIDLIRLCGRYRAQLHWQDMGYPYQLGHVFMEAGRDPELFE